MFSKWGCLVCIKVFMFPCMQAYCDVMTCSRMCGYYYSELVKRPPWKGFVGCRETKSFALLDFVLWTRYKHASCLFACAHECLVKLSQYISSRHLEKLVIMRFTIEIARKLQRMFSSMRKFHFRREQTHDSPRKPLWRLPHVVTTPACSFIFSWNLQRNCVLQD